MSSYVFPPTPEPAPAAKPAFAPAPAAQVAQPWTSPYAVAAASASAPASKPPAHGGLYLQLASLRTAGDAQAFADGIASRDASVLAGLKPIVVPAVIGNMGTFYTVRLGPVASNSAGNQLCAGLRKAGVDCYFATP